MTLHWLPIFCMQYLPMSILYFCRSFALILFYLPLTSSSLLFDSPYNHSLVVLSLGTLNECTWPSYFVSHIPSQRPSIPCQHSVSNISLHTLLLSFTALVLSHSLFSVCLSVSLSLSLSLKRVYTILTPHTRTITPSA
jgi:hypothetical protein